MGSWLASWRFMLSRRWALFFLAVLVLGYGTWWLGEWQFGRLADRKESNAIIETNETRDAVDVTEVMKVGRAVPERDEWRLVEARGEYLVDETIVVRYRTRDSAPGVEVVVPFLTGDGATFLVDRGWYGTDDPEIGPDELPEPPAGEVSLEGWVRADGTGGSTEVTDQSTRAIASGPIGEALGRDLLTGFVALKSEDPRPDTELAAVELPDLGQGPHFFYGLQWWFFGVLAAFGFGYLAWDERANGPRSERLRREPSPRQRERARRRDVRRRQVQMAREKDQRERERPPSTGSITPDTNDDAGESTKAATRPNSSGAP